MRGWRHHLPDVVHGVHHQERQLVHAAVAVEVLVVLPEKAEEADHLVSHHLRMASSGDGYGDAMVMLRGGGVMVMVR